MKTLLGFPSPQALKRSQLWACAALNQLAFPGLGSVIAGRRAGYAQAAIFLLGFMLLMGFMFWYLFCALRFLKDPAGDEEAWRAQYRSFAWAWKSGLLLCVLSWFWALVSSVGIVRQAQTKTDGGTRPAD